MERVECSPRSYPLPYGGPKAIEGLISWLHLKGAPAGDLGEAFHALVGERATGVSVYVIVRCKD